MTEIYGKGNDSPLTGDMKPASVASSSNHVSRSPINVVSQEQIISPPFSLFDVTP